MSSHFDENFSFVTICTSLLKELPAVFEEERVNNIVFQGVQNLSTPFDVLFFKQVQISPKIDWYQYQSANAAPTDIVRHRIKTEPF